MKRVIERCPNCGVEHDDPKGGACEVCGTTLRFWCRVHSKDIGWLETEACPRCAAEFSRTTTTPSAAPPPAAPTRTAPLPRRPSTPPPAPPPRREEAPPRVEREEPPAWREPEPPPRVEPEEGPVWIEIPPPRRRMPRRPGRDPRVVIREGAEDLAPYAEAGASMAVRMVRALFAVAGSVIVWGLLGAAVGFFFPDLLVIGGAAPEPIWTVIAGAMVGGGVGLLFGTIRAIRILFSQRPRDG